jgi:hypothetical protein
VTQTDLLSLHGHFSLLNIDASLLAILALWITTDSTSQQDDFDGALMVTYIHLTAHTRHWMLRESKHEVRAYLRVTVQCEHRHLTSKIGRASTFPENDNLIPDSRNRIPGKRKPIRDTGNHNVVSLQTHPGHRHSIQLKRNPIQLSDSLFPLNAIPWPLKALKQPEKHPERLRIY